MEPRREELLNAADLSIQPEGVEQVEIEGPDLVGGGQRHYPVIAADEDLNYSLIAVVGRHLIADGDVIQDAEVLVDVVEGQGFAGSTHHESLLRGCDTVHLVLFLQRHGVHEHLVMQEQHLIASHQNHKCC